MDKSFYQKEAAALQDLYEKFNEIQFASDENEPEASQKLNQSKQSQNLQIIAEAEASGRLSKDMMIVATVIILFVVSMVGFLTMWLVN